MFLVQSPFERMRLILADVAPGPDPIDLTVGGPKHASPAFIAERVNANANAFLPYPPIAGTANLQRAMHDWLDRRYNLGGWLREAGAVLPLSGSREGLFLSIVNVRDALAKTNPTVLFANPFYQAYPSAAHAIGAEAIPLSPPTPDVVLPDFASVPRDVLDRAIAYYVGAPTNPAGAVATRADWHTLFDLAERHDFVLFADECYSEIYREASGPPLGALEVARERPEILARLLVFNSLSKRSNIAGLRAGLVAGHPDLMGPIKDFRNQVGPQVPIPLQEAAAAAYDDEAHVAENRRLYDQKFSLADRILGPHVGPVTPPAGFCLWIDVGDDVEVTRRLWGDVGVKVMPGSVLATDEGGFNPGAGRIRVALVSSLEETREALERMAKVFATLPADAGARAEAATG